MSPQIATPDTVSIVAALLFAVAIVHTFSTWAFERLAHVDTAHAGLWRLLGEVEVVFGFWAAILILFMATQLGTAGALDYLESRNFTEPAFVFAIMVIAASRPVIDFAGDAADAHVAAAADSEAYGLLLYASVDRPAARLLHHRAGSHDADSVAPARLLFQRAMRRATSCTPRSACCLSMSRSAERLRLMPLRRC